jgi:hypothetical protein
MAGYVRVSTADQDLAVKEAACGQPAATDPR